MGTAPALTFSVADLDPGAAGLNTTLILQFAPTATGAVTGQLTLNSNSITGGTAAVALSGTGTAAANPQLTISASSLSFGNLTVNTASTLSLTRSAWRMAPSVASLRLFSLAATVRAAPSASSSIFTTTAKPRWTALI